MDGGVSIVYNPLRGSSDGLIRRLLASWFDSVSTCFTQDADKLCVPAGLTLLSALLLLLSHLLIICQRCRFPGEYSGEASMIIYSFLGNLCSSVGATLSTQLHILVFMSAFAALMDSVSSILCCLPVFLCWNSNTQRRLRMIKKRRRQHLLAVGVLMVVAGGFLKSRDAEPAAYGPESRRLLHVGHMQISSWTPSLDYSDILGYTLGMLSLIINCTSRFPALCRAARGQSFTQTYIFSGVLCSLSGAVYAAAILLCDARLKFLIRVLPWLLSSTSCAGLDLLILFLHWCRRGTRQTKVKISPDTESLLGSSGDDAEETVVKKQQTKQKFPSSGQTKMTLKEGSEATPLQRKARAIEVDSLCSSDTSYGSSPISSDLEWDCEAAISQWNKPAGKPRDGNEFPLQDCPTKSKPFRVCVCSMSELPKKTVCAANKGGSAVS
nr:transmembrane protein 44 isoform X2 [Nothobranchius furzeri]